MRVIFFLGFLIIIIINLNKNNIKIANSEGGSLERDKAKERENKMDAEMKEWEEKKLEKDRDIVRQAEQVKERHRIEKEREPERARKEALKIKEESEREKKKMIEMQIEKERRKVEVNDPKNFENGPPINEKRGDGSENMPDGPEKEAALKRDKKKQSEIIGKQNVKIKKTYKQNALQRRIDQLITENGKGFLTFLWLQRKYAPNPFEPVITSSFVWIPLGEDENFHIRTPPNFMNPSDPFGLWIPNAKELERLTDMMLSHSFPLPPLFIADITIIQLEIYAKWFKKYYIDKDYSKKDNPIVKNIKKFINSL